MDPELFLLAEHGADLIGQLFPLFGGVYVKYPDIAAVGIEDAGQHLDGGAFARPVGADEGQDFPLFYVEGNTVYRFDFLRLRVQEGPQASLHSFFLPAHAEGF